MLETIVDTECRWESAAQSISADRFQLLIGPSRIGHTTLLVTCTCQYKLRVMQSVTLFGGWGWVLFPF
jgi:hypothetical protein